MLIAGLTFTVLGTVASGGPTGSFEGLAPALLTLGCLAFGSSVAVEPRSSVVLGLAGYGFLLTSFPLFRTGWESTALVVRVFSLIAAVAAVVQRLPRSVQRTVVSLLILLHLGGVFTAALPDPWLTNWLSRHFYRPYLQFMYLDHTYDFFAPEPGPTPVMWFCIQYESDGEGKNWRWVKLPACNDAGRPVDSEGRRVWPNLGYIRRLSLAGSVGMSVSAESPALPTARQARLRSAHVSEIPLHPEATLEGQFEPPSDWGRWALSSYVRHLARTCKHPAKPQLRVTGIKVYRVIHNTIRPQQVAHGISPDDPTLYWPYYWGEYEVSGRPKRRQGHDTPLSADDPLLYWLTPIVREPSGTQEEAGHTTKGPLKNYVYVHAGVPDCGELP